MLPNKHQLKTEATRKKLLSAALRIFSRDGFERSRLEDIASEAGHTRGALYANFANKEDLFIALLEFQAAKRFSKLKNAVNSKTELREYYLCLAKDRSWAMLTLEFKLYALRHSKNRAQLAAAHRRIRDSVQLELKNHGIARAKKHTKILLEVVWTGLVLEHEYDPTRISVSEVADLLGRMFDLVT